MITKRNKKNINNDISSYIKNLHTPSAKETVQDLNPPNNLFSVEHVHKKKKKKKKKRVQDTRSI